jgi:hypothetical protein
MSSISPISTPEKQNTDKRSNYDKQENDEPEHGIFCHGFSPNPVDMNDVATLSPIL